MLHDYKFPKDLARLSKRTADSDEFERSISPVALDARRRDGGFRIAMNQPDRLGMLLASGITFWIGLEAVVNMAVLLGLLPFAGNALPFFSYGGSSLVTNLAGIGLLLNISRWKLVETKAKDHVATLGFGRRHGGRSVSRLSRRRRTQKRR